VTLDPEGNRTSTTTPKGQTTLTTYDELGKPLDVTQPPPKPGEASPVTHFRYDENRNLIRMEDGDGRVTKLDYDELNRLFRTTRDPDGLNLTTTTTDFDEDGHPLRILEANGEVTRQTWDELGRLATRTHEPPASGWTAPWAYTTEERYGYDANSNLERVRELDARTGGGGPPERVTTRGYDKLDRQTSETVTLQDETTSSVTTEYFKDGRVKSVTDPRGATSYTYDGQGREETVTTSGGVTRKTYYPDGLVKDITFPNGTKRAHGYDKADRLLTIVTTKDESALASTAHTYDPNGNRLTQLQTNGGSEEATTYTYDDLDRLATVTYAPDPGHPNGRKVTYGHDGAGNRQSEVVTDPQTEAVLESKTGHFDNANRLTELTDNLAPSQTTTLLWDKNGNLLYETKAGVTTNYRYDLRDTLAEVERGGQPLARFLGDFDERRVLKIGDPTRPGGSGVQEYLYNGSRLVVEVENGQSTARYEWTNEELVSLLQSGGVRRYFALDGLETVLALTDEAGQATDRLNFDAWGVPKEGTDFGTSGNRFAFTSHRFDTELDLYYAGGRMYSPTIGRFISQDNLSLDPNNPDSWNLFNYALTNPTRYVDPTGHASFETQEIGQLEKELGGYHAERDETVVPKVDRAGDDTFERKAVSPVLWSALHRSGGKEGALKRLKDFRAGNVKNYAITIIEESDFDSNGGLNRDKLYQQFLKQVGGHAGALKGLREEFFEAVEGARAGESREISFLYNVAYEYSALRAEELARQDAEQHFGPDFIQRNAHLAGQWGAAPPDISAKAAAVLAADTVAAAALGLEVYRAGAAVLTSAPEASRAASGQVRFKRWRRGEAIDKPLPDGSVPSWDVTRQRYWKNRYEASKNTGEFSASNLERIRRGRAPVDYNPRTGQFEERELHHVIAQQHGGPNSPLNLRELTPDWHAEVDALRIREGVKTTRGIR
jgi:RHS repeat-associated protein